MDLGIFDLINLEGSVSRYETDTFLPKWKVTRKMIEEIAESPDPPPRPKPVKMKVNRYLQFSLLKRLHCIIARLSPLDINLSALKDLGFLT